MHEKAWSQRMEQRLKSYNYGLRSHWTPRATHYIYSVSLHHIGQTGRSYSCLLRTHFGLVYCDPGMDTEYSVSGRGTDPREREIEEGGEREQGREEGRGGKDEKGRKRRTEGKGGERKKR